MGGQRATSHLLRLFGLFRARNFVGYVRLVLKCPTVPVTVHFVVGNQYQGSKVDIWSLGCILYIMLYGCNPFMQFNDNETLIKYKPIEVINVFYVTL